MHWYNPADDVDSVKHCGGEAVSAAETGAHAVGSVTVYQVTSAADPWDSNGGGVWGALGVESDILAGPFYPAYHLAVKTGLLQAAAQPYEDAFSSHGGGLDGSIAVGELASGVTNAVNGYHDLEQGDYLGALGNGAIVGASLIPCGRGAVVARDAAIGVLAKDEAEVAASDQLPLQMHHFATRVSRRPSKRGIVPMGERSPERASRPAPKLREASRIIEHLKGLSGPPSSGPIRVS